MPKTLATVLVLLVSLAVTGEVNAQGQNQGNPTILGAVRDLQSSVNALASQLTTVTNQGANVTIQLADIADQLTSLTEIANAIGTPPTVISTGSLFKPTGFSGGCSVVNAGTSQVTVTMELRLIGGQLQQSQPNLVLGPGEGNGFGQAIGSLPNHVFCRFTMINGSSSDIRANLSVVSEATGLGTIREAR